LLAYYKIPEAILTGLTAWGMGFAATGFFVAGVFLVVGCFLDAIPAIIICAPILEPLAKAVAMDPVRRHPHPRCHQGHGDHAGADAAGARPRHRLAEAVVSKRARPAGKGRGGLCTRRRYARMAR
jgi:Tripartite ATP-independent periplasmic transporter, DctM component